MCGVFGEVVLKSGPTVPLLVNTAPDGTYQSGFPPPLASTAEPGEVPLISSGSTWEPTPLQAPEVVQPVRLTTGKT